MDSLPVKNSAVILILMLIAATGGFYAGKTTILPGSPYTPTQSGESSTLASSVFKSQTATFQGVITKVDGKNLQVKSDSGNTASFPISERAVIYKFSGKSPQASASSDLKTIETDKQALVMLELLDNNYQVVSVSYLPPPPAPPAPKK